MQQRRLRLGDILDDYCPRERRITNHAVVAMIDNEVKQTRCTTCDSDHEYRQARVPPARRKKADAGVLSESAEGTLRPRPAPEVAVPVDDTQEADIAAAQPLDMPDLPALPESPELEPQPVAAAGPEDEGPVHRRLIRATLPRPEGQVPERKNPEFTVRQPGTRGGRAFDGKKDGHRHGHGRRPMHAHGGAPGQLSRFGGPHQGSGHTSRHGSGQPSRHGSEQPPRHGSGQAPRHGSGQGNRSGHPGQRSGGPGQGHGRGGGRKRGR